MLNKFLAVIAVLLFSFSAIAQNIEGVNARLDAMAGSGASDDIGWTIRHPASLFNYPNQCQGTIILMPMPGLGETYGAVIGIVQLNELLYAGVTLNNRVNMPGGFYEEANQMLNAPHINIADYGKDLPNLPQVNLCLKLSDNFQLGLGGGFEAVIYNKVDTKKLPYDTPAGAGLDTIFYHQEYDNVGMRNHSVNVEARIKVGGLTIYPQAMVGFPRIRGTESYDNLDAAIEYISMDPSASAQPYSNIENNFKTPEGLFFRGASYFWGDIGNTFVITGLIYENARFQLHKETIVRTATVDVNGSIVSGTDATVVNDTINSDHNDKWLHFFFGFIPSFSDNLYFSPEYDAGFGWFVAKDPDTPSDTLILRTYHNFRLGIEKYIEDVWFFDKFGLRAGIKCQWNKEWRKIDEFNYETQNSDEVFPWSSTFWGADDKRKEAKVVGGFGITKGRGTFDVSCDFLKWQGMSSLTGPSAAMATITVDFSRNKEF